MAENAISEQEIANREHISFSKTGDNIAAKKNANYGFDLVTGQWNRAAIGAALVPIPYDYVGFTNADGNGNYQTATFKQGGSSGTTVATLSLTYDANNLITSITRT